MKTAISLPDDLYRLISEEASARGISRSQFLAEAASRHLRALEEESLTRRIDAALDLGVPDESSDAAVARGRQVLRSADW